MLHSRESLSISSGAKLAELHSLRKLGVAEVAELRSLRKLGVAVNAPFAELHGLHIGCGEFLSCG